MPRTAALPRPAAPPRTTASPRTAALARTGAWRQAPELTRAARRRTAILATGAALLIAAASGAGTQVRAAAELTRKPYLQNLGRRQVTIMWRTATPATMTIEYSEDVSFGLSHTESKPTTHHEVTLADLVPGTKYNYRITEDGRVRAISGTLTFQTDLGRDDKSFSFFVTGDVGEDDPLEAKQQHTQAMIRTMVPVADFGLLTGDIIYPDGASERYDAQLMTPWAGLLCSTPVWPTLGNHDWHVDPALNFEVEWSLPNNEHYYSFDYGNARFIALDSADKYWFEENEQLAFLARELEKPSDATWTFVYYHHPLLTCTYKGDVPEMGAQVMPLFERYGVDVVFTGHAHTYERLFPIANGLPVDQEQDPYYIDPQGTIYVVTGCGGKFKVGKPTTFCGPTAAFHDESILFTQVFVQDLSLFLVTVNSVTGEIVDVASITKSPTVSDVGLGPAARRLQQNIPNPFNPATGIPFELSAVSRVHLAVYRPDGRWIANLTDRVYGPGTHRVVWSGLDHSGRPVSSGVYVARLQTEGRSETIKMMLLR
ncbi:MAG: purple acid phosphatase family protein [Candidatus Krumholzibacteriia bacterium]